VKNNRSCAAWISLEEQVVYQVDDEWVAYGTWVANAIAARWWVSKLKKRLAAADRLEQVPRILLYPAGMPADQYRPAQRRTPGDVAGKPLARASDLPPV
jgi:hypothetical protein